MRTNLKDVFHLSAWSEIIGTLADLSLENDRLLLKIEGKYVALPICMIRSEDLKRLIGKRIGILRTDLPGTPFLIRLIRE